MDMLTAVCTIGSDSSENQTNMLKHRTFVRRDGNIGNAFQTLSIKNDCSLQSHYTTLVP